jgi:phosphate uptake regulator
MRRKVIRQGHNTLTVTLPNKWAKRHGVEAGNEIEVKEQEKSLIITTDGGSTLKRTVVDISGLDSLLIWRHLVSAYRAGYNEIIVKGIEHSSKNLYSAFSYNTLKYLKHEDILAMSPIETINACVNRLIGVEIMEQKENQCVIKEMSDVTGKEFDNALRRIFHLMTTEADEVEKGLEGKTEGLKAIHIIDTNLDRFEDFCFRVLNILGYSDFRKTPVMHSLIFTLELIGDEFKKLAMHMLEEKKVGSKFIKELFQVQKAQLNRINGLFYSFNKRKAFEIYDEDRKGTELIARYYPKLSDYEKEILHHFKKIGIYVLSLTELRIDLEF